MLYSENLWEEFSKKKSGEDKKKYKHFDHPFDFENFSNKIKKLVSDPSLMSISRHSFMPFLKMLTKTPRYKYQDEIQGYKLETKIRPISFASHFDSLIYSFYSLALSKLYEQYIRGKKIDESILAYRTDLYGACNIQFAKKAFDSVLEMNKRNGNCIAICLDISGYFDDIDHDILKKSWCTVINQDSLPPDQFKIYNSLTKYSYCVKENILKHFGIKKHRTKSSNLLDMIPSSINGSSFKDKFNLLRQRGLIVQNKQKNSKEAGLKKNKGIPQGSSMSSVLSNIYLIEFDNWIINLSNMMDFKYFRYCDDLLLVCKSKDASYLLENVVSVIKSKYELTINVKKSELIEFSIVNKVLRSFNANKADLPIKNLKPQYKNLQYLGFEFNGSKIYIRPSSLSRYFRKAKGRIVKTMMMAYGKKSKIDKILKRQLYERYTHFGKRNFITYAQNASKKNYKNSEGIFKEGLNSPSIRRQLSAHFCILEKEFLKTSGQFSSKRKLPLKL